MGARLRILFTLIIVSIGGRLVDAAFTAEFLAFFVSLRRNALQESAGLLDGSLDKRQL